MPYAVNSLLLPRYPTIEYTRNILQESKSLNSASIGMGVLSKNHDNAC